MKTTTPCAISPVLLECPEQGIKIEFIAKKTVFHHIKLFTDCSKKYKHANGLKYHQSHAHGAGSMDEDSQQLPESPRDSQQLPDSPPPSQKHAPAIHTSPLPSSRSSLSSFESIVASGNHLEQEHSVEKPLANDMDYYFVGFSDVTPTPPPVQQDQSSEAANQIDQSGTTGSNTAQTTSAQRSRTPTPSLDTKPSSVPPSSAIQESNQASPSVTSELNALPLISQTQSATNNSVSQTAKNDSQGKGKKSSKHVKDNLYTS